MDTDEAVDFSIVIEETYLFTRNVSASPPIRASLDYLRYVLLTALERCKDEDEATDAVGKKVSIAIIDLSNGAERWRLGYDVKRVTFPHTGDYSGEWDHTYASWIGSPLGALDIHDRLMGRVPPVDDSRERFR